MVLIRKAAEMAKRHKPGYMITSTLKYKDYYVFFMQPEDTPNSPLLSEMDCYVIINIRTGKFEYFSIYAIADFFDKAVEVRM